MTSEFEKLKIEFEKLEKRLIEFEKLEKKIKRTSRAVTRTLNEAYRLAHHGRERPLDSDESDEDLTWNEELDGSSSSDESDSEN